MEEWKYQSEPRKFMGFRMESSNVEDGDNVFFDAVYIPTNFYREIIKTDLTVLSRFATKVFIIPSEKNKVNLENYIKNHGLENLIFLDYHADIMSNYTSSSSYSSNCEYVFEIPAKRNAAIKHAIYNSYNKILLLDDDITLTEDNIRNSIGLLTSGKDLVGFYVLDSPDISSINHVEHRLRKNVCQVSVGGNCLAINVNTINGFFPNIYNEDWLFIYGANHHLATAAAGIVKQTDGKPWENLTRVKFEQFGELIAAGIKKNLIAMGEPLAGSLNFWKLVIDERVEFLNSLALSKDINKEYQMAIYTALDECKSIKPSALYDFITDYKKDIKDSI